MWAATSYGTYLLMVVSSVPVDDAVAGRRWWRDDSWRFLETPLLSRKEALDLETLWPLEKLLVVDSARLEENIFCL